MERLAKSISLALLKNNVITKKELELCEYGMELFLICVLELGSVLILSIIFRNFLETLIFFVGFIPIRIYSGGYHADTRLRCFIILLAVYALFSFVMRMSLVEYKYILMALSVIAVLLIAIWDPLKHENKNISEKEKRVYHGISITVSIVECGIIVFMILLNRYNIYLQAFILGLFTAVISLTAGKIKKFLQGRSLHE